jgi:hypothetical protein
VFDCVYTVFDKVDGVQGTKIQPGVVLKQIIVSLWDVTVISGIITTWFVIVLRMTSSNKKIINMLLNLHYQERLL